MVKENANSAQLQANLCANVKTIGQEKIATATMTLNGLLLIAQPLDSKTSCYACSLKSLEHEPRNVAVY